MLAYDRQQAVLDFIREHHSATVTELSKRFFISETSIRRDLAGARRVHPQNIWWGRYR